MNNPYGPPPRNVSQFVVTRHLKEQMKDRHIGWYEVSKALEEGTVEQGSKPSDIRFRLTFPGPDLLVVVDTRNNNISTAFYSDKQGASHGGI